MTTTPPTSPVSASSLVAAHHAVQRFTVAAMATGAIPVPAAFGAIVAENAAMVAVVAAACGVPVSLATVAASM